MLCQKHDRLQLYYTGCQRKKTCNVFASSVSGTCNGICSLPEVYREFPTAVCIKCRNHFPTVMQTILWKERYSKMMRKQPSPRCSFLQQVNEVSFAVNDMLLYLDTHPEDQKTLRYFSDISDRRNQLMAEYAEKYGPLTIDSAAVSSENAWKWSQQPFPWEKEGACR